MIVSRSRLLVLLLVVTGAGATAVRAQAVAGMGEAPAIVGTYTYVAEGSDDIEEAIDDAVSKVSWFIRTFARSRLRNTNPLYERIVIERSDTAWSILVDDRKPVVAPVDGSAVKWEREDGEVFDVSIELLDPSTLKQLFVAEDGERENLYRLGPGGDAMSMTVTIRSPKLKEPLVYTWNYERVDGGM